MITIFLRGVDTPNSIDNSITHVIIVLINLRKWFFVYFPFNFIYIYRNFELRKGFRAFRWIFLLINMTENYY